MYECFVYIQICLYTICAHGTQGGEKRVLDPWDWRYSQMIESHCVGVGIEPLQQ